MEMIAMEDIAIGQDLTPSLPPLAFVLHDSALSSSCSACFSTLPPQPFPPNRRHVPSNSPTPLYCSPNCSSIDSPLHFSSAEPRLLSLFRQSPPSAWEDSSDLRLSLRLIHLFQKLPLEIDCQNNSDFERIADLMTNREKLMLGDNSISQFQVSDSEDSGENTEYVLKKIREGAKLMAKARAMNMERDVNVDELKNFVLEEMILCLVLTNAVEIQDKSGCSVGIAVYDTAFSWVNHSCSPNACYRFVSELEHISQPSLKIAANAMSGCGDGNRNSLIMEGDIERNGYGPRVIVRSIKCVKKGEEVTIAYTDLLQPKEMRGAELWLKYRFLCSCERCCVVPTAYVDYALQALSASYPDNPESSDDKLDELMQNFDDATTDYLTLGDPESCCKKLENLLSHGHLINESIEPKKTKSSEQLKVHPFHYLSLNAYTTLASAYKVQASDLLALNYDVERHKLEAFNLYKTSAAYSLLIAGVQHHLFMYESALVATVANFWINAGESLLDLARNSLWDSILKPGLIHLEFSSFLTRKCSDRCIADTSEPSSTIPDKILQLEEINRRFYNCVTNITTKVWRIVASESSFLRSIQSPIDFSWLASSETCRTAKFIGKEGSSEREAAECDDRVRMNLFLLSIHCLRYGSILSSICYG